MKSLALVIFFAILLGLGSNAQARKFEAEYDGKVWAFDTSVSVDSGSRSLSIFRTYAICFNGLMLFVSERDIIQAVDSKGKPIRCRMVQG